MLFDEKELNIFDSNDARQYFQEILQSYYGKNYRATVVLLYSFTVYDLFSKLQTMSNEGDKTAKKAVNDIRQMIEDDEKYSTVENTIINFFKDNCKLYFRRFIEDIEYLKKCRNKCAHLNVDGESLFIPSDYQVRMLICSMYDNIFAVKAPFIMDLFSVVKTEVEVYSNKIHRVGRPISEEVISELSNLYFKRLTQNSLKKSFETFLKITFQVKEDDDIKKNINGLFAFTYSMASYITQSGLTEIFNDDNIVGIIKKIEKQVFENSSERRKAFITILLDFPGILDCVNINNHPLYNYISELVLSSPKGIQYYNIFFPRENNTAYDYYLQKKSIQRAEYTSTLFEVLKKCENFKIDDFMILQAKSIPNFDGYNDADAYMNVFKENIENISSEAKKIIMEIYNKNIQCTRRNRHSSDMEFLKPFLDDTRSEK